MKRIQARAFGDCAKEILIKANTDLRKDIVDALKNTKQNEKDKNAVKALDALLKNQDIARKEKIPFCQDTGYTTFFVEVGTSVCIEGNLLSVLNEASNQVHKEMPFRNSIVNDPIERNMVTNTHVSLYREDIEGDKVILKVIIKGAGSDNSSSLNMFLCSTKKEDISKWVIENVKEKGPHSCPPLILGIGIGGSFEKAALLSKKAFFRKIGQRNTQEKYSKWEQELLDSINKTGIGPSALGGQTTALEVFIEQAPVHMASMPVAINMGCHALRTAEIEVGVSI